MNQQSFLRFIESHYDFTKANKLIDMTGIKPYLNDWLTVELSLPLSNYLQSDSMFVDAPYQGEQYLKYIAKNDDFTICDRRYASKADLLITLPHKKYYFEFITLHSDELTSMKELKRLTESRRRVLKMGSALPNDEVVLIVALYGSFSTSDLKPFKDFVSTRRCAHALDTNLRGSTSVANLLQIVRHGEPRLVLFVY